MLKLNQTYEGVPTVTVIFLKTQYAEGHERTYTYLVPSHLNPHMNDLGIVEKEGVYSIVKIIEVHKKSAVDINANYRYKWLVGIVNPDVYNSILAQEDKLIEQYAVSKV